MANLNTRLYINEQVVFTIHPKQTKQHANIDRIYGGIISSQIKQQAYSIHTCGSISLAKTNKTPSFTPENQSAILFPAKLPPLIQRTPPEALNNSLLPKKNPPGSLLFPSFSIFRSKPLPTPLFLHQPAWLLSPTLMVDHSLLLHIQWNSSLLKGPRPPPHFKKSKSFPPPKWSWNPFCFKS